MFSRSQGNVPLGQQESSEHAEQQQGEMESTVPPSHPEVPSRAMPGPSTSAATTLRAVAPRSSVPAGPPCTISQRRRIRRPLRTLDVELETMSMLRRIRSEDQFDDFAHSVACCLRKMPQDRQSSFISVVFALLGAYGSPGPLANVDDLTKVIWQDILAPQAAQPPTAATGGPCPPPPHRLDPGYTVSAPHPGQSTSFSSFPAHSFSSLPLSNLAPSSSSFSYLHSPSTYSYFPPIHSQTSQVTAATNTTTTLFPPDYHPPRYQSFN